MELLKFATFSHSSDVVSCIVELGSLSDRQVKVDIAVTLQEIVLNLVSHEFKNLILDSIIVHECLFTHSKPLGHLEFPLDLVWEVYLVLSAVVLETTWGLPGGGLWPREEEGHVPVQRILDTLADALVQT